MAKPAEDLRRVVLDASLDLIEEKGLAGLSMREAARRAGVSHQAPYHHFGDREGILAAIVSEGFDLLARDARKALEGVRDPVERLGAIGRAYVRFALKHPAHFKLMFHSEHVSAKRHGAVTEKVNGPFEVLVETAREAARGRIEGDRGELAIVSWGLAHGLATLLLEGKLGRMFGESERAQLNGALKAMDMYLGLLRD